MTGTKTYYPAGGAMKVNSTLYFILKDHLGSASVVTDAAGTIVGEDRFYPYGETRFTLRLRSGQAWAGSCTSTSPFQALINRSDNKE